MAPVGRVSAGHRGGHQEGTMRVPGIGRLVAAVVGLLVSAVVARRALGHSSTPPTLWPRGSWAPERLWPRLPIEPGARVLMLGPADVSWIRAMRQAIGRYGTLYVAEPSDERATRLPGELRALNIGGVQVLQADTTRVDLPDA